MPKLVKEAGTQYISKSDLSKKIDFGMKITDAESMLGIIAIDDGSPIARKGIDQLIKTRKLILHFDSGKLKGMDFKKCFDFKLPLSPFREPWKNFSLDSNRNLKIGMDLRAFKKFVNWWEKHLQGLGLIQVKEGELSEGNFKVNFLNSKFITSCHISFGPSRVTSKGGLWEEGWGFIFTTKRTSSFYKLRPDSLIQVSASNDSFNTMARKKPA